MFTVREALRLVRSLLLAIMSVLSTLRGAQHTNTGAERSALRELAIRELLLGLSTKQSGCLASDERGARVARCAESHLEHCVQHWAISSRRSRPRH